MGKKYLLDKYEQELIARFVDEIEKGSLEFLQKVPPYEVLQDDGTVTIVYLKEDIAKAYKEGAADTLYMIRRFSATGKYDRRYQNS